MERHARPRAVPTQRGSGPVARLLALQRAAGNAAVAGMFAAPVQRLAAQISVGDGGATIRALTVRGRPDSPFKDTMGDHTTAFLVQVQSVRNAVVGKDPAAATAAILELVDRARRLPGAARVGHLGAEHGLRLGEAAAAVEELAVGVERLGPDDPRSMTTLQDLIGAYLQFRELIPFSTLNIRDISAGLAGLGKGEPAARRGMAGHETAAPDVLRASIVDLFDAKGVALLATRTGDAAAARVAPGVDPANRIAPIVAQHLSSISAAYPGAVMRAWGSVDAAQAELLAAVDKEVVAAKAANVELYNGHLSAEYGKWQKLNEDAALIGEPQVDLENWKGEGEKETERDPRAVIVDDIRRFREVVGDNGGVPVPPPRLPAKRVRKPTGFYDPQSQKRKSPPATVKSPKPVRRSGEDVDEGPGSGTATQIELTEHGVITDLRIEGRPPSPFPGGRMGAHTTAWVVHKDVIRGTLIGCTLAEAFRALPDLGRQADVLALRLASFGAARPAIEPMMTALARQPVTATVAPLVLQDAVNALLAEVNLLPGVALDAVNTKPDREGAQRTILLQHERHRSIDAAQLRLSLLRLLDIRSVHSAERRLVLLRNHLELVERAYPMSYEDSGLGLMDAEHEVLPMVGAKTTHDAKRRKTSAEKGEPSGD